MWSDDQAVASWKFQPAVWLAVVSSITNLSIAAGFSQGASITWWRSALHGTDLRSLHHIWSFGRGDFRITRKWSKDTPKIALVALVVGMATVISNPLLQRAIHVENGYKTGNVEMLLDMMKDPLDQQYGVVQNSVQSNTLLFVNFVGSVQNWYRKIPISTSTSPGYYCNGTCEGVVVSPGIESNCSSTKTNIDLASTGSSETLLFAINFTRFQDSFDRTVLGLEVTYSAKIDAFCHATIYYEQCNISTAMVERPIRIDNQTLSFDPDKPSRLLSRFYSPFDSIYASNSSAAGPLDALYWLGEFYFLSSFSLDPQELAVLAHGIVPVGQQYLVIDNNTESPDCGDVYTRPTPDIIDAMEEVLFRMAYNPSPELFSIETQNFSAYQVTPTLVFHSNYHYLGIAVSVMALASLAVLTTLWGWWELRRQVSLSPVETAMAFGAPLLQQASKEVNASDLINDIGDLRVKYSGVIVRDGDEGTAVSRLGTIHPEAFGLLLKGERFSVASGSTIYSRD